MRAVVVALLAGTLLVCGCGAAGEGLLDDVVLHPDPEITQTPAEFGFDYKEHSLPVAPGRSIAVWHVRSVESKALVLVVPGSAGNKGDHLRGLSALIENGYDAVFFDYEGFGDSPGEASLEHAADDALTAVAYAMTQHSRVAVCGISLGAALAARVAAEYPVCGLILESTPLIQRQVDEWVRGNPWQAFWIQLVGGRESFRVPEAYDTLAYVSRAPCGVLVMHSPADSLVPFSDGLAVYDAAPWPKYLWQEYGDHVEMVFLLPGQYGATVVAWLDRIVGLGTEEQQTRRQGATAGLRTEDWGLRNDKMTREHGDT